VGLLVMGKQQADHQQIADPANHFMCLLCAALASGRAHIASTAGAAPIENLEAWGWRRSGNGDATAQGRRVGWLDGEDIFLDPEAAHAEAQKLAGEQGDALTISSQTLGKRLRERGYLTCIDQERERLTVRRTCQGARRQVWQVGAKEFLGDSYVTETVPTVPIVPEEL